MGSWRPWKALVKNVSWTNLWRGSCGWLWLWYGGGWWLEWAVEKWGEVGHRDISKALTHQRRILDPAHPRRVATELWKVGMLLSPCHVLTCVHFINSSGKVIKKHRTTKELPVVAQVNWAISHIFTIIRIKLLEQSFLFLPPCMDSPHVWDHISLKKNAWIEVIPALVEQHSPNSFGKVPFYTFDKHWRHSRK